MSDPWADVREGLTLTNELLRIEGDYSNPDELLVAARSLLADADALLGMLLFAGHKPWCTHCDCGYEEALAALPEHLRES